MSANRPSSHCRVYVCVQREDQMYGNETGDKSSGTFERASYGTEINTKPIGDFSLDANAENTKYWDQPEMVNPATSVVSTIGINFQPRQITHYNFENVHNIRRNALGQSDSKKHGRPSSLSSVASSISSRTSRCSDYFVGSPDHVDSFQSYENTECSQLDRNGVLEDCIEETAEQNSGLLIHCDSQKANNNLRIHRNGSELEKQRNVSVRDINKRLSEVDHLSPISSMAMRDDPALTYVDRIMLELVETERMYVRALEDVLGGYLLAMKSASELSINHETIDNLFGNIKKIYAFNRKFLSSIENCIGDPVAIAKCFIKQEKHFQVYAEYCTNYPTSIGILTRCMKVASFSEFLKAQQTSLQHALPLGSYLLKPVQRVLKYHLLIQDLVKNCSSDVDDYSIIKRALDVMTKLAHHINEMKRKHEDTVYIQEIQSMLGNWKGDELATYGEIVKEGELKFQGAKTERYVYLFDKMLLITKKRDDGVIFCKHHILCSDIVLLESISGNPLSFIVAPFNDLSSSHGLTKPWEKVQHQITAPSMTDKLDWTYHIKKLIIKHHHAAIPLKAQRSILRMNSFGGIPANPMAKNTVSTTMESSEDKKIFSRIGSLGKIRRRSDSSSKKSILLQAANKTMEISNSLPSTPSLPNQTNLFSFDSENINLESVKDDHLQSSHLKINNMSTRNDPTYSNQAVTKFDKQVLENPEGCSEEKPVEMQSQNRNDVKQYNDEMDDLLLLNFGNNRQSVSWDIQIVDEVFNHYKNYSSPLSRPTAKTTRSSIPKKLLSAHSPSVSEDGLTVRKDSETENVSVLRVDSFQSTLPDSRKESEDETRKVSVLPAGEVSKCSEQCTVPRVKPPSPILKEKGIFLQAKPLYKEVEMSQNYPTHTQSFSIFKDSPNNCDSEEKLPGSHNSAHVKLTKQKDIARNTSFQTQSRPKGRRHFHNNILNMDTKRIPTGIVQAALSKYENSL